MIILSKDINQLIYTSLQKLDKIPKVENVDSSLKELVKHDITATKIKATLKNSHTYLKDINITDRLIDSYIGVILKKIRTERVKRSYLDKRIKYRSNYMNTIMSYYNMTDWEILSYKNYTGSRRRDTIDLMKRDFTKKVIDLQSITVEAAYEEILRKYFDILKTDLLGYAKTYFKINKDNLNYNPYDKI